MPLQNRVDPYGVLFRHPTKAGIFMGNRGPAIHNERQEILRPFAGRRWIICLLQFRGRARKVMSPGLYTELFFLDEAVAFSAGHRPCAECRRERFHAFRAAWGGKPLAPAMDDLLHPARIDAAKNKVTWHSELSALPRGCFVELDGAPWLVRETDLLRWTPEGYTERRVLPAGAGVTVLTPEPIVRCFRAGYLPQFHPSATAFD